MEKICKHKKTEYKNGSGTYEGRGCEICDVFESRDLYNGGYWHPTTFDEIQRVTPYVNPR